MCVNVPAASKSAATGAFVITGNVKKPSGVVPRSLLAPTLSSAHLDWAQRRVVRGNLAQPYFDVAGMRRTMAPSLPSVMT